jgi:predicted RNA-binding Zn ribbon-like protein
VSMRNRANNTFFVSEPGGREAAPGPLALVQAFVNTVAEEGERRWEAIGDADSLRSWFARRGLLADAAPVGDADVARVREVREALRALLAANNGRGVPATAVATLNGAAGRAGLEVRFGEDGRAVPVPTSGGIDGALGAVLAAVHSAMEEGTWGRLKSCRNERCGWAFYDRSRNRSGAWCSMDICGNRTKTRAYRQRRSARDI